MEHDRNLGLSYGLALVGFLTPFAGLHRFYLNRPFSGFVYLVTWGLFGIGTLVDLIRMPKIVHGYLTTEQHILRIASAEDGIVTAPLVASRTHLSMRDAQAALDRMHADGFVELDLNEEGAKMYTFPGLRSKKPLMIEGVDD